MNEYDFKTDTSETKRKFITTKIGTLIGLSIFLLGFVSIPCISQLIYGFYDHIWIKIGTVKFAWQILRSLCVFLSLASLVKIAVDEKPFSKTLTTAVWIIGGLFLLASIIIPRLPDYSFSGFAIIKYKTFILIDGWILLPGILLIILGCLIKAGFELQKETDETI